MHVSRSNGWLMALAGVLALMLAVVGPAAAAKPDPKQAQALVEDVTDRVLAVLDEHSADGRIDVDQVRDELDDIVLPHLDFVTMTKLAVGHYWRQASDQQKRTLVTEFRNLLVRTYTTSLDEYQDEKLEFLPLWPSPHDERVTVRSRVLRGDGPPIAVNYGMRYNDGEWKVYDIVVEDISLVTTYQSQFGSTVQRDGIAGLIEELKRKNEQGEVSPEAPGAG